MNKFIAWSTNRIIKKELLKFGVDPIIQKNPEHDINYTVKELQKVLDKTIELFEIYKNNWEKEKLRVEDEISKSGIDYIQVKKLKEGLIES